MADFEQHAAQMNIKEIVVTMILSALGFLVALSWRDAIKETIDLFLPAGEGLFWKYVSAMGVTLIAVAVTLVLIKIRKANIIPDEYEEKIKKRVPLK